jgi:hypothetical protein
VHNREEKGRRQFAYTPSPPQIEVYKIGRTDDRKLERQRTHYEDEDDNYYCGTPPNRRNDDRSLYQPGRPTRDGWDIRGGSSSAKMAAAPKRPVELDSKGVPLEKMMKPFKADVKAMARAMDPSEGYLGQTAAAKEKLMERIQDEYEFHGAAGKVSQAYIKIIVGKALIKYRHELNKLIDAGENKPHNILSEFWTKL